LFFVSLVALVCTKEIGEVKSHLRNTGINPPCFDKYLIFFRDALHVWRVMRQFHSHLTNLQRNIREKGLGKQEIFIDFFLGLCFPSIFRFFLEDHARITPSVWTLALRRWGKKQGVK
jgi:hypothetical protein